MLSPCTCLLKGSSVHRSTSVLSSSPVISMTFPSAVASDDPDPTSQMAWPTRRQTNEPASPVEYRSPLDLPQEQIQAQLNGRETRADAKRTTVDQDLDDIGKRRLSAVDLFNLTVSMAGAQIAWTVELG